MVGHSYPPRRSIRCGPHSRPSPEEPGAPDTSGLAAAIRPNEEATAADSLKSVASTAHRYQRATCCR